MLNIILRFLPLLWYIIKKRVSDRKPSYPLKGRSVGGSARIVSIRLSTLAEAGQRTDAHLTDPSTYWPTNGIRPKNTTASDRKIVQWADSVPCLGKKISIMPLDRIENSVRWHNLHIFSLTFLLEFVGARPLTYSSRSARSPSLL
jgi:hypothetical protein